MQRKNHKVNPFQHQIEFKTDTSLHIRIETKRLLIQSITPDYEAACIQLFLNPDVMEKYGAGIPIEAKRTSERVMDWTTRWQDHDPYGAYVITDKTTRAFLGIIVIGHSLPGESEAAYLIHKQFWGKGYGSEIGDAVFQSLVPRLMMRGYALEHKPLKKLVATARFDNPASQGILTGAGFKEEEKTHKFGAWRQSYGVYAKQLRNEYHHFFDRRDRQKQRRALLRSVDTDVDITAEEMAKTAFVRRRE